MSIRVPDNMSSREAFDALYRSASVSGRGKLAPSSGLPSCCPWNTIQLFVTYYPDGDCDYVRGKLMKVDFRTFPDLDVREYDKHYGEGMARKALKAYKAAQGTRGKISPYESFDLAGVYKLIASA